MPKPRVTTRKGGRVDALDEARDLVALLGTLSREGSCIDASSIAGRMGITTDDARKLIELLVGAGSPTTEYLPVASSRDVGEGDDEIVLMSGRGVRGRPLRLNRQEMTAVIAALNMVGVPADDPLRERLQSGFSAEDIDETVIAQTLAPLSTGSLSTSLLTCSRAILEHAGLRFDYRGVADSEYKSRFARPLNVAYERSTWYLAAIDVDRGELRTFRVDRMRDVTSAELPAEDGPTMRGSFPTASSHSHYVTLVLADRRYLSLFDWPGLEVIQQEDERITARIPLYDNAHDWLIRRITACGGTVTVDDAELAAEVRSYAKRLLGAARIHSDTH